MLNNNDNQTNTKIKLEEVELNPERKIFENKLRRMSSKEDINHYFETINEVKVLGWENKLFESKLPIRDLTNITDPDILSEEISDFKTMRIIRGDIDRTRVQESIYMTSFKEYLYQLIIYYIKKNKISYKQGLNEIAGPFILLKYKLKLSFTRIYKLLVCFIDKFLTNYFSEKEFFSLQSSFGLINLLLQYHDTELFRRFEYALISPDLYATSWIMTLFANKCELNVIYYLWDKLILFDDTLFPLFFITAYLILNRDKFFVEDYSVILTELSQMHIDTIKEVNEILDFANEIRDKTPNSFYLLANKLEIFNYDSQNLQILYEKFKPNLMLAMPIFPTDIFCITHKNIIRCPDVNCENFKTEKFNTFSKCLYCRNREVKKKISFIIIDIRIFDNEIYNNELIDKKEDILLSDIFPGFLPKTIRITSEQLNSDEFPKNILKDYTDEKEKYHFIIITSDTKNYFEYDHKFYKFANKKKSIKGVLFKRTRKLDNKKIEETFGDNKNKKEYFLLKEFDYFKKLIDEMNLEKFKYVSYAFGGYKDIHSFAMEYNIDLLEHGKKCVLCEEKEREKKEKNRKNSGLLVFKFW